MPRQKSCLVIRRLGTEGLLFAPGDRGQAAASVTGVVAPHLVLEKIWGGSWLMEKRCGRCNEQESLISWPSMRIGKLARDIAEAARCRWSRCDVPRGFYLLIQSLGDYAEKRPIDGKP